MISWKFLATSAVIALSALLTLVLSSAEATPLPHTWSANFGDADSQGGINVLWDPTGAIIEAGHFEGTTTFGGNVLVSAGGWDVYVVKLDASGGHIWSNSWGATGDQFVTGMDVDAVGNVVITGYFYGSIDFGGGVLTSAGDLDFYIAKFRFDGVHEWSMSFGDAQRQRFGTANPVVTFDGIGDVIMTGEMNGVVDFGGGPLAGPAANVVGSVFLAKFNSLGSHSWSGLPDVLGGSLAVTTDNSANIIISVNQFHGFGDYGGGNRSGKLGLAMFTRSGGYVWSNSYPAGVSREIEVDAFGRLVMAGNVFSTGAYDFGGTVFPGSNRTNIFVARYDHLGSHLMSAVHGGSNNGNALLALTTDPSGNILVGGSAFSDWGGSTPVCSGSCAIMACYDSTGAFQWSERFVSSPGFINGMDYREGSVVVDGFFTSASLDLGGGPLQNAGAADIFIARFDDEASTVDPTVSFPAVQLRVVPDPFVGDTRVFYEIESPGSVSITVFDTAGAIVARPLRNKYHRAGSHEIPISLGHLVSGVYFVQVDSAGRSGSKRIVLIQ